MHIGIASPITVAEFTGYIDEEYRQYALSVSGMRAPAVDSLILGLLKKGHHVSVYTLDTQITDFVILKGKQLTIILAPLLNKKWWRPFGIFTFKAGQIRKCIEADEHLPELLHAHWTYEYAMAALSYSSQLPVVITVRDWAPKILRLFYKNYYYYVHYILDYLVFNHKGICFLANSEYIADKIQKRWKKKVAIVPNPVNNDYLLQAKDSRKADLFTILSISNNICKIKNVDKLIRAFHHFHRQYPQSQLQLIGGDFIPSHPSVKQWESAGLLKGVELIGPVPHRQLVDYLDRAHLLVHPSLEESFGNIYLEAMARHLPVIGGKYSGATPYILKKGEMGILCDVTSAEAIAEAIEKVYTDPEYGKQIADKAYRYVKETYSEEHIARQTISIYHSQIQQYAVRD